jgi:thioredoxin 1
MTSKVTKLTDSNFTSFLSQNNNVLIDFYAPWCGPCRMIEPLLERLSETEKLNTMICKVNIDESPQLTALLGIRAVPTILFFKEQKPVDKFVEQFSIKNLLIFIKKNE